VLGPKLRRATATVLEAGEPSLHALFGSPDDMKFHSSMTLFSLASDDEPTPFSVALERWFDGRMDKATLALLNR